MVEVQRITTPVPLGAERGLPFTVRTAHAGDVPFVDMLQKRYSHEVGFLPRVALEQHVERGRIAIGFENDEPAGYILAKSPYQRDRMMGIMYQAAVAYDARRRLLGTALVEHAVGLFPATVRLVSAWVAQDIEANLFWESCGFEPIAARRGSETRGRVHIFWQRRTMAGDRRTALRFPESTRGGCMRAGRVVVGIDGQAAREGVALERLPVARRRMTPADQMRRFRFGASQWMYVMVNGVGRYLPTAEALDVPKFMSPPRRAA